jgi:hypothetical protein
MHIGCFCGVVVSKVHGDDKGAEHPRDETINRILKIEFINMSKIKKSCNHSIVAALYFQFKKLTAYKA